MMTRNTQWYLGDSPLIGEKDAWGNWAAEQFYRNIENRDPKKLKLKLAPGFISKKSCRWSQ